MEFPNNLVVTTDRRFLSRESATADQLRLVGVDPKWTQYIRIIDQTDKLVLLHYINTYVSETDHTVNESPLKEIGHVRGTIIDTEHNRVVCVSYPYTPDVVSNDPDRLNSLLPSDLSGVQFYNACEGTIIRMFWLGKWYLSTHRKIDANNSYWSGPTFGEMFEEVCKFKRDDLDKDLCYTFLLSHDGNRLIYTIPEPQLLLITIYNQKLGSFLKPSEYGRGFSQQQLNPTGVEYPTKILSIKTVADLQSLVDQHGSYDNAGIICIPEIICIPDSVNPQPIKVVNPAYNTLRDARGNDPHIRSRYIQLRGTPEGGLMVNWFNEPKYKDVFDNAEKEVDELVEKIHKLYVNRYVNKDFSALPKEEFVTLQRCHGWHTTDRTNNIVTCDKVREFLNTTPTHFLLMMLNRFRKEKRSVERANTDKPPKDPVDGTVDESL